MLRSRTIREDHDQCDYRVACPKCLADDFLTDDDWYIVGFFRMVSDQVTNLTPQGTMSGTHEYAPRLEGWLAAADLCCIPQWDRERVFRQARFLHGVLEDRIKIPGLFSMDTEQMIDG